MNFLFLFLLLFTVLWHNPLRDGSLCQYCHIYLQLWKRNWSAFESMSCIVISYQKNLQESIQYNCQTCRLLALEGVDKFIFPSRSHRLWYTLWPSVRIPLSSIGMYCGLNKQGSQLGFHTAASTIGYCRDKDYLSKGIMFLYTTSAWPGTPAHSGFISRYIYHD